MKRLIIFLLLIPCFVFADNSKYLPTNNNQNLIVSHPEFTLSYNEEHEQPDWVAYEITKTEANTDRKRCNCFYEDDKILTESATPEDYVGTGFDKGHLSPAAANNISDSVNKESFLMSNMSPQLPSFNRGIWAKLEKHIRDLLKKDDINFDKIYVVTGPVFTNNLGKIGANKVTIPGYFYKALLRFEDDKIKTIGFLLPHIGATGDLKKYATPINTIETLTGLNFFSDLDDSKENNAEFRLETGVWGL